MTKPILFSGEMIRAILASRKTQTRRICKVTSDGCKNGFVTPFGSHTPRRIDDHITYCPYGQPGDLLWVRETWWECIDNNDRPYYAATETPETTDRRHYRRRPSIFMPRAFSRITLRITAVRVERLRQITEHDAISEGITCRRVGTGDCRTGLTNVWSVEGKHDAIDAQGSYELLWESINGPGSWDTNPWVWVIEFEQIKGEYYGKSV